LLTSPEHQQYFFDRLKNPAWVDPLEARGFFQAPPSPESLPGGVLRCRPWPQSQYLARMASSAPESVSRILGSLNTDNWFVVQDAIEALRSMPPQYSAPIASRYGAAVDRHHMWHQLERIAELAAQLVEGGFPAEAMQLALATFTPRSEEDSGNRLEERRQVDALRLLVPALLPARPKGVLALLVRLLFAEVRSGRGQSVDGHEFSYIWRPAIEDHARNSDSNKASELVALVRDGFDLAIRSSHLSLSDAVVLLDTHDSEILKRIRIHLIAEFAERDTSLAKRTMLDRSLFFDFNLKHEYARLVRMHFGLLDAAERGTWLEWIDAGPKESAVAGSGDEIEDRKRRREYWQFERLGWVQNYVEGPRLELFERMRKTWIEPEQDDLDSASSPWGHTSPFSAEELAQRGFLDVIKVVTHWRPRPDQSPISGPSVEGLVSEFRKYLDSDPVGFAVRADALESAPAPFVRCYLEAIKEAVKCGASLDLAAVLRLCRWVESRDTAERTVPIELESPVVDPNWQWCRDAIAMLVEEICKARDGDKRPRFRTSYRERIWEVLEPLLSDSARSNVPDDRTDFDPRLTDWLTKSINSPRGRAMFSVFEYAGWVAAHDQSESSISGPPSGGLDAMPEVRSILEQQWRRKDDNFTARAPFGWRLGLLLWLDKPWLEKHADEIFALRVVESDPARAFGWAAWNTFLTVNRPHMEFYELLRWQFGYAVRTAAKLDIQSRDLSPIARLAEHLVVLYGRGSFGDDPEQAWLADGEIIRELVVESHISVRTRAIEFVGVSLQGVQGSLPAGVLHRFQYLWERYWELVGSKDATHRPGSNVFGDWFSSGVFESAWSLLWLEEVVSTTPRAGSDSSVMTQLAKVANVDPARSARIVRALVQSDEDGWRIYSWKSDAMAILGAACAAGGEARTVAKDAINMLGRRGYAEFGTLLPKAP